ncbi:hypothetical protein JM18_002098 [Phytophthora kernoviae]|uniref:Uncharacterized protein n=2 Tax=Phytophthora kernoviae TaxID=325452 RepID=A0A8T0M5G4_9STRA|nr:hypothetical protein G195_002703 [Phytophthora kernoviae 00238/432]KAG2528647.1 hypothetical protein JM16_002592 [Phytophthora kernoviae]KAG2530506.1 hypothetical protein JM18_002098 [Phytophthora kernoviae]
MDPRRLQNETRYSDILHDHNDVYHEADEDSLDEDEDEDGLEEQSDYSVFAQSRFTEASRDSVATTNRFDADDGASSIYSGTSTSYWQQESSVANSMVDWNQASSVQPADGFIYEPQASQMSSNFFGASNFTADEDYDKQTGHHYNSTTPIPEDEPATHSNNTNGESYTSHDSYASTASSNKILSIQKIAKARSARYGITSQFPPPPPPPPLSPPPEEEDEEDEVGNSALDAGSLRAHNLLYSSDRKKDRSAGGSRKIFTPPKNERSRNSHSGSHRKPKVPRKKELNSAAVSNDEGTRVSHIDSTTFGNTRSSAILQQSKFSSSFAILETPDEFAQKSVAMMERQSVQRGSNASTLFDEDLVNRSTEDMTEHINSLRARNAYQLPDEDIRPSEDMQKREEKHRKRMEELTRLHAEEDDVRSRTKLSRVEEPYDEGSDSDRSQSQEDNLEFMPSVDEHTAGESNPVKQPITISTSSTEASERVSSPRESCMSDMSELDEDLVNRPTDIIYEQVRANRGRKWQPSSSTAELHDGDRSSEIMYDIEESHRRRMEELNRIAVDHLGNRISNLDDELFDSSYRPARALPSSVHEDEVEEMQWRSTNDMDQYESKHMRELEGLRRKIRQLEEECRESLASVLTPEEMDLSEFDDDSPADATDFSSSNFNGSTSRVPANAMGSSFVSANAMGSSFISTSSLDMNSMQPMPPQPDGPVSARVLYEQIAQLTQLQSEMAMAKDDADEEEYRLRIKEQYRLLRTIKVHGHR